MKWGIRRSPEQLGHKKTKYTVRFHSPYEKKSAKLSEKERKMTEREEIQRRKNQLKERKANLKNLGKSKDTIQNEKKPAQTKRKSAKDMTDDELRNFINRYNLEKQYSQIVNGPEKKKGSDLVKDMLAKSALQVGQKYTTKAMEAMVEEMLKKSRRSGGSGSGGS